MVSHKSYKFLVGRAKFGIDFTRFVMKAPAPTTFTYLSYQPFILLSVCELWDAKCYVCLHFDILLMPSDKFNKA